MVGLSETIAPAAQIPRRAMDLLGQADTLLTEATCATSGAPAERFRLAYLAALRGASALLAARPRPARPRTRSAWGQLTAAEPALADWAAYFADYSRLRTLVEAGVTSRVDDAEADRVLVEAERFLNLVEDRLGR